MSFRRNQVYVQRTVGAATLRATGEAIVITEVDEAHNSVRGYDTGCGLEQESPFWPIIGEWGLAQDENSFLERYRLATPEEIDALRGFYSRYIRNLQGLEGHLNEARTLALQAKTAPDYEPHNVSREDALGILAAPETTRALAGGESQEPLPRRCNPFGEAAKMVEDGLVG